MPRFYRFMSGLIIAVGIAFIGLGLYNQQRGLPAGSLAGIRTLPGELAAGARRLLASGAGESITRRDTATSGLQALRTALGCEAPVDQADDPGFESASYRWRDASGVMNFSDRPPEDADATRQSVRSGEEEFFVTVRAEDAVLPATMDGAINAGARRVYEQWRDWLGDEALVRSHINIRFIGDGERFHKIYGREPGEEWTATGFYRISSNEALVLYAPPHRNAALNTAFHEMSHLIAAWHLGLTPPWLNEGLAEHFETMQVNWQGTRFAGNAAARRVLRERGPLPLDDLLSLSRQDWGRTDTARHYASAWALIAFLLDDPQGRATLEGVIRSAHAQRCDLGADPSTELDSYPGGRRALERDWQRWVARG